jgi:plasmid replication initiation protein
LVATNRETSGDSYRRLREAFERLAGTRITTNLAVDGLEVTRGFGLIEGWEIVRKTRGGRMISVSVTLSDWLYRAVLSSAVLTLSRDYFRLRKPLERRIYELARKHCGRQAEWRVSLATLQKKCGSNSTDKEFRRLVRTIVTQDRLYAHIPDYAIELTDSDMVVFTNRGKLTELPSKEVPAGSVVRRLKPEAYARARDVAPEWDVYYLEQEWRDWMTEPPRDPEAAFVGFCRKWFEKRGRPA